MPKFYTKILQNVHHSDYVLGIMLFSITKPTLFDNPVEALIVYYPLTATPTDQRITIITGDCSGIKHLQSFCADAKRHQPLQEIHPALPFPVEQVGVQ